MLEALQLFALVVAVWRARALGSRIALFVAGSSLMPRAYALDGVAMPFIAVGLVDALEAVLLIFAWLLLGDDVAYIPRNPS